MPQPVCQRKEMLYVLKHLVGLDSSSKGVSIDCRSTPLPRLVSIFPSVSDRSPTNSARLTVTHIPPSTKRHLFTLFPLISQCIAVAQGDQELLTWLSKALDEMGAAFGVY